MTGTTKLGKTGRYGGVHNLDAAKAVVERSTAETMERNLVELYRSQGMGVLQALGVARMVVKRLNRQAFSKQALSRKGRKAK